MNVLLNTDHSQIEGNSDSSRAQVASRKAQTAPDSKPVEPAAKQVSESSKPIVTEAVLQANVILRRDSAGKIYYVFTDAQSGKELREFPAAEVRKAGQG